MKHAWIKSYVKKYRKDVSYKPLDGGWGWAITLAAGINQASFAYHISVFSLLFSEKFQDFGVGSTGATIVLTITSAMAGISGLIKGPLIKYVSYQFSAMIRGVVAFLGYVTLYFVTELWHLVIGMGVLVGLGTGFIFTANTIAINNYFENKKTWAIGIAFSGASVSQIVMPYVIAAMLKNNGYGGTVLLMGGLCLNSCVASLLFHPLCEHSTISKDQNVELELTQPLTGEKSNTINSEKPTRKKGTIIQKIKNFFDLDILVNPTFTIMTVYTAIILTYNINAHLLLPMYLKTEIRLSLQYIALYMSIRAAGDVISRIFISWILSKYRVTTRLTVWISGVFLIISRSGIVLVSDVNLIYFFAFLERISRGMFVPNVNICYSEDFTKKQLPNTIGLDTFFRIIGQFAVGALIGYLCDSTGKYSTGIHVLSGITIFGLFTWVLEYAVYYIRNNKMKLLIKPKF